MVAVFSSVGQGVINETILWTNYSGKIEINEQWSAGVQVQRRDFLDRDNTYHLLFSASATRKLKNGFGLSGGFINLNINQPVGTNHVFVPEYRPFQRIQFAQNFDKSKVYWHMMIEERWRRNAADGELVDGYRFNFRYRNMFRFQFPVAGKLDAQLISETHVNSGREAGPLFDQHRGSVLGVVNMDNMTVSFGYMQWVIQTDALVVENRHTIVLSVNHSF